VRYPAAAFGGTLWWASDSGRRKNARANYGAVLGLPEDHPEVRRVAKRAFENYTRMLADFLLMGSLQPEEVRAMIRLEGPSAYFMKSPPQQYTDNDARRLTEEFIARHQRSVSSESPPQNRGASDLREAEQRAATAQD